MEFGGGDWGPEGKEQEEFPEEVEEVSEDEFWRRTEIARRKLGGWVEEEEQREVKRREGEAPETVEVVSEERFLQDIPLETRRLWDAIEGVREVEEANELVEEFRRFIRKGTKEELYRLLQRIPQNDPQGRLRYLLTSGMAVELLTGVIRPHHDLDLVIMHNPVDVWDIYGTDNVTPQRYWADMKFDPRFLKETERPVELVIEEEKPLAVWTVNPAIIFVQKLSNAFSRAPRTKDYQDAQVLFDFRIRRDWRNKHWEPIIARAIEALPQAERERTRIRVEQTIREVERSAGITTLE